MSNGDGQDSELANKIGDGYKGKKKEGKTGTQYHDPNDQLNKSFNDPGNTGHQNPKTTPPPKKDKKSKT